MPLYKLTEPIVFAVYLRPNIDLLGKRGAQTYSWKFMVIREGYRKYAEGGIT